MRKLLGTTAIAAVMMSTGAQAEDFGINNMYVIGDSLSDGGTYSVVVGGQAPDAVTTYYQYTTNVLNSRTNDGSGVYVDYLADNFGIELAPAYYTEVDSGGNTIEIENPDGGTNYAQGGALVTGDNPTASTGITMTSLEEQIDRLLASDTSFSKSDLITVWGGANDVLITAGTMTSLSAGKTTVETAAANLSDQVDRLLSAGSPTVFVMSLPDIGETPRFASDATSSYVTSTLSSSYNARLKESLEGKNVVFVDTGSILSAAIADPERFGFTVSNTGFACPNAIPTPGEDPTSLVCVQEYNAEANSEEYIFADGVHMTDAANRLLGQIIYNYLPAAYQVNAMSVATMQTLRQQAIVQENRLNPNALYTVNEQGQRVLRASGNVNLYGDANVGYYSADDDVAGVELDGFTESVSVGADVMVYDSAIIGVSAAIDHQQMDFEGDAGSFYSRIFSGSVYGLYNYNDYLYVNGSVGGATIDFYEINREYDLTNTSISYESDTGGTYGFARIGLGSMIPVGGSLKINPYASFTYEKVTVDAFTEKGDVFPLSYGETSYESKRLTGSLSVFYSPLSAPEWNFAANARIEHDLNDDDLEVPINLDSGGLLIERPSQTWGSVSAQASRSFAHGGTLSLAASSTLGIEGTQSYSGSVRYKLSF
ncbi:autotransporter domain-containing protein [Flexibacterium corallicola]|uniref:autotransporter domain-containing protein n=1 Tax=Flexibacterium corallicola TaxID=3037259 RepID=UPI00286EB7E8|nr:autotransporter domain-containing protein [Pseudovibrio sp. M1P-2-3]